MKIRKLSGEPRNLAKGSGIGIFLFLFGIPFFAMGCFGLWQLTISPVLLHMASDAWVETPCEILESKVENAGDNTYRVYIKFAYRYDGQHFESERYNVSSVASSGKKAKKEIVDRHPKGKETVCFVNPEDPTVAVIDRQLPGAVWFGLLTLIFVFVGGGLMTAGVLGFLGLMPDFEARRNQKATRVSPATSANLTGTMHGGEMTLRARNTPVGKFIFALLFGGFWNGIVSIFVVMAIKDFGKGDVQWFLVIFLIPFVVIGLGAIGAIIYQFLALFNPRAVITIEANAIRLGDSVVVNWEFTGRSTRIQALKLTLEGREEATYRRGTNTHTAKNVFYTHELRQTSDRLEISSGETDLSIPANAIHSFESAHNKIIWEVKVEGDIPNWPDVDLAFEVPVLPLQTAG